MKANIFSIFVVLSVALIPATGFAQNEGAPVATAAGTSAAITGSPAKDVLAPHPSMKENTDGILKSGEYEVISTNGSISRSVCPYTCEMRGLPKQYCRAWPSKQDPSRCYLEDTRIPSSAVPLGK